MRRISLLLALVASLFATSAHADFTGKDAAAATITFKNPNACTSVVCTPIFSLYDPTGTNGAAVDTAGADAVSNTKNGLAVYSRSLIWNGTTWDRWTGDLASGAWVNVKASAIIGTTTDAPCTIPTSAAACSLISVEKAIANLANTAPPLVVNGANQLWTGLTPGVAQTGTKYAANTDLSSIGGTAAVPDPCQTATKAFTPISTAAAGNTIITAVAAKKKYICGIFLYPAAPDNVAIYQATTATACATAPSSIFGGVTTATGFVMTAQAGFAVGNGASAFASTNLVNTDICITTSAAVQLSGVVVTVDQ